MKRYYEIISNLAFGTCVGLLIGGVINANRIYTIENKIRVLERSVKQVNIPQVKAHVAILSMFTDANIIDAIVGEAANQTEDTMLCVAQAIRNRGTLEGVYGFHAAHNEKENAKIWADAAQAWTFTKQHPEIDNIGRAKNFGIKDDLAHLDHGTIKAQCGDFYFY